MFVLITTIIIGVHATTSTAVFDDARACKVAAGYVRADIAASYEKSKWAPRVITTCAPKSSSSASRGSLPLWQ